jgi:putative 4-mercaptohistidine N1-methyltranferase
MQTYEADSTNAMYLEFHYGTDKHFGVENFPKTCAQLCLEACKENNVPLNKAIDLGCSVGRSTFELAKGGFQEVVGVDLSQNFIKTAKDLQNHKRLSYTIIEEGDLVEKKEADVVSHGLDSVTDNITFVKNSASELDFAVYNSFDLVFAGNLLCRIQYPRDFLKNIRNLVKQGGLFVLVSKYAWLTEYTDKSEWVGGFERDGRKVTTYDGIKEALEEHFEEVKSPQEVEFVIKETKRKFERSFSQATYWKRK